MRFKKKTFKTILGICAFGAVGVGICQEYILNKENNFKNIVVETEKENDENVISHEDLIDYEVVEMRYEDESKLFIARPNNFNDSEHKIYYNIFTNEDIIGNNESSFVTSTPIQYYLYNYDIKTEYSKEELKLLLKNISQEYDYEESKTLKKEI